MFFDNDRAVRKRAEEVLEWAGLSTDADRLVKTYSGGMRRRLDLAISARRRNPRGQLLGAYLGRRVLTVDPTRQDTGRVRAMTAFRRGSVALTKRWLWHLRREPAGLLASLAQPVLWLLLFGNLFANSDIVAGHSYIAFMTAGVVVMTASNGAPNGGVERCSTAKAACSTACSRPPSPQQPSSSVACCTCWASPPCKRSPSSSWRS